MRYNSPEFMPPTIFEKIKDWWLSDGIDWAFLLVVLCYYAVLIYCAYRVFVVVDHFVNKYW